MKMLNRDDILKIHEMLADKTGGSKGLKDEGLLDSALQAPFQTYDGEELYEGITRKAAKLGHGIISNHPFVDGNKRIGVLAMLTFLELNGYTLDITDEKLVGVTIGLACGGISYDMLEIFINENKRD